MASNQLIDKYNNYGRTRKWQLRKELNDLYEKKVDKYHRNKMRNLVPGAYQNAMETFPSNSSDEHDHHNELNREYDSEGSSDDVSENIYTGVDFDTLHHSDDLNLAENLCEEDKGSHNNSFENMADTENISESGSETDPTDEPDENGNSSNESDEGSEEDARNNYWNRDADDNDLEENGNPDEDPEDPLLFNDAPITLSESLTSIFTYAVTNNLTGTAFSQLLELISFHLPADSHFKKTTYMFMKHFEDVQTPMTKHYYCSKCHSLLDDLRGVCQCGEPKTSAHYFIELSIVDQLQQLLLKPSFDAMLMHPYQREKDDNDAIYDIYDGVLYKENVSKTIPEVDKYHLSFTWYTDGAPVFKSRKYSIWPFYLIINELPYKERIKKENIIVAGIWFGPSDIEGQIYLIPTYEEISLLQRGVNLQVPHIDQLQKVKVILLAGTCDTPAKADVMCMKRFNGEYGCSRCLIKGTNVCGNTFGRTHVYPYEKSLLRTDESYQIHSEEAEEKGVACYGINAMSILHKMMPNIIRGISIDVMHCAYLGGAKRNCELWIEGTFKHFPFSLHRVKHIIDSRLMAIKPPSSVKRMPRSIVNHLHYFKASELRNWFFYYSPPVLADLFQDQAYFEHYLQFVMGIYLLNQRKVTIADINTSDILLKSYVSRYQHLYGLRFMTHNLHSLLHLPTVVTDLGPVWVTSCFPFEDLLGKTVDYVHGTRHVGLQIYSKIVKNVIINEKLAALPNDSVVKKYCNRLLTKGARINEEKNIGNGIFVLGKLNVITNTPQNIQHIIHQNFSQEIWNNIKVSSFHRLKKKHLLIHAQSYPRKTANLNYCIVIKSEDLHNSSEIGFAKTFLKLCLCNDHQNCKLDCQNAQYYVVFTPLELSNPFRVPIEFNQNNEAMKFIELPYMYKVDNVSDQDLLIEVENIVNVCFVIEQAESTFIAECLDTGEYDQ